MSRSLNPPGNMIMQVILSIQVESQGSEGSSVSQPEGCLSNVVCLAF